MTNNEFLQQRRSGIGGSDAAAVCGMSPWKTPLQVYLEKIGEAPEQEPNRAMIVGKRMEPVVLQDYIDATQSRVTEEEVFLRHPKRGHMICHVDRMVPQNGSFSRIVELKTVGAYAPSGEWGEPGTDIIPRGYMLQCQHMLSIVGALYGIDTCDVAVLFMGSREFALYQVKYDAGICSDLDAIELDFWEKHVLAQVPPEMDGSAAAAKYLANRFPTHDEMILKADADTEKLIADLKGVTIELNTMLEWQDKLRNQIKEVIGGAAAIDSEHGRITWRRTKDGQKVDYKALLASLNVPAEKIAEYTEIKEGSRRFVTPRNWLKEA